MDRQIMSILAVALALLIAGCGDSGDDALTKAEFLKQGDAICKETLAEISSGYKSFFEENELQQGDLPSKAEGHELAEEIYLPAEEDQVESLRELTPPEADEDKVDAILTETEDGLDAAGKNPDGLLELGKDPLDASKEMLQSYGFKICGTV